MLDVEKNSLLHNGLFHKEKSSFNKSSPSVATTDPLSKMAREGLDAIDRRERNVFFLGERLNNTIKQIMESLATQGRKGLSQEELGDLIHYLRDDKTNLDHKAYFSPLNTQTNLELLEIEQISRFSFDT